MKEEDVEGTSGTYGKPKKKTEPSWDTPSSWKDNIKIDVKYRVMTWIF
jgi:hypothetical protein